MRGRLACDGGHQGATDLIAEFIPLGPGAFRAAGGSAPVGVKSAPLSGDSISGVELDGKVHDAMNDSTYERDNNAYERGDNPYPGGGAPYPRNGDLYQKLLGVLSELCTSRTGLRFLDRYFTEPVALDRGWLPRSAGVYAILVSDSAWEPRPYRPIYFGEAEDLARRGVASHEKFEEWRRAAGAESGLYVAYHLMAGSDAERTAFGEELIREYRPACNDAANESSRLGEGDSERRESFG
jgi:hypothetical protein